MTGIRWRGVFLAIVLASTANVACAASKPRPLVDPFPLRFPLVEAGSVDIAGHVVGQPRTRDGVFYCASREGVLTAFALSAGQVFWRYKAESSLSAGPEPGENHILFRDDANTLYALDMKGGLVFKMRIDGAVTTAVREHSGRLFVGTEAGKILAFEVLGDGKPIWEYRANASVVSGPVFADRFVIFGLAADRLLALDESGKPAWEFVSRGAIRVDPLAYRGRLYFGTDERFFYCLDTATGKAKWSRRLEGAPLHPALAHGNRLAVAASNSVVYFLSARGGSVLAWESIPSRIIYQLAAAGPALLVSSAGPSALAFEFANGKRVGLHLASHPLAAGAEWAPPFLVVLEEDEKSGRQRLVMLRPRAPSSVAGHRR